MADDKLKVSPGLEDRLLEYAAAAEAFGEHGASDLLPALPLLDSPETFEQLADMTPIHAYKMHGAIVGDSRGRRQRALEELHEICARELTRRHREFGVLNPAPTDDVADADIVGWIGTPWQLGLRPSGERGPRHRGHHHR